MTLHVTFLALVLSSGLIVSALGMQQPMSDSHQLQLIPPLFVVALGVMLLMVASVQSLRDQVTTPAQHAFMLALVFVGSVATVLYYRI